MLRWVKMNTKKRPVAAVQNIYHCCAHKAGSQWIRSIFADDRIRKHTEMDVFSYTDLLPGRIDRRHVDERFFNEKMPEGKVIGPLYLGAEGYRSIPKPERYASFYVFRHPKDLVVSYYFSVRYSHKENEKITEKRKQFGEMNEEEGLLYTLSLMDENGFFRAMRSWFENPPEENEFRMFRFEELTDFSTGLFAELLRHCSISLTPDEMKQIHEDYSFPEVKKNDPGKEMGHYRSGKAGDWKNYFTPAIEKRYNEVAGDLAYIMGYVD